MNMMFSADNHISEPVDAWQKRMSSNVQDRAPRYARDGENIVGYIDGEVRQVINAMAFGADLLPEDANDVEARLQVLEKDGLWGEALLGNLSGVVVMSNEEPKFALECARAYNEYLAESFGPYRDRGRRARLHPDMHRPLARRGRDRAGRGHRAAQHHRAALAGRAILLTQVRPDLGSRGRP